MVFSLQAWPIPPHIAAAMHRLATRHIPRGATRAAAWVVAFAVLVQGLATVPLALHLLAAAGIDRALGVFPLCGNSDDRADTGGSPSDDHEHCLSFCQGVFGAAAILPGPLAILAAAIFAAVLLLPTRSATRGFRSVAGYASRGPPFATA
jgi:hypothetical protein